MKPLPAAVLLLLALHSALALPSFDPFADASANNGTAYTVGGPLAPNSSTNSNGSTNLWALVNSGTPNPQPTIVAGNLSYPGLPASTGNSVSNAPPASGSGGSARVGLNGTGGSSVVYYSFILQVTDLTAVPSANANNPIAAFSDTVGGQAGTVQRAGGRLVFKTSGGGYVVGVGKGTTTADYVYDSVVRNVGDILYVVVSYERVVGATNVNLWVNPAASTLGSNAPPTPTASVPQGVNGGD